MNGPFFVSIALALVTIGQAPAPPDSAAEGLEFMKKSVQGYEFIRGDRQKAGLRLQPEPVFRLGKQYNDVKEGAIFLWLGAGDRPEAAAQVFKVQNSGAPLGVWIHEFTSLSTGTYSAELRGRTVWNPSTPGVEFKPLPGAPEPADTPARRSRQISALARDFRATDDKGKKGWIELRMLTTPIARYGKPESKLIDGALIAFVEGTDPEVFLFLEARAGARGLEWQYALAPMTVFAVKASYNGKNVWDLPDRQPSKDPSLPFFDFVEQPSRP